MLRSVVIWGLLLWVLSSRATGEQDIWSAQLMELKTMMSRFDSKMSSLENKLANLRILDYAFSVNNVDRHLLSLDTKVSELGTKVDNMQQVLNTLCAGALRTQATEQLKVTNNDLMEKIDDYGQKLMINDMKLLQSAEKEDQQLNTITNISRSGFSKLYHKIDLVMSIEGQMTGLTQTMNGWTPRLTQIIEQLSDVVQEIENVRFKVERNGDQLSNTTEKCSGVVSSENQTIVSLQSMKQVLELANTSEFYASQLQSNLKGLTTVFENLGSLRKDIKGNPKEISALVLMAIHYDLEDVYNIFIPTTQTLFNDLKHLQTLLRQDMGIDSTEDKSYLE